MAIEKAMFQIQDYHELLALHRTIMAAKFASSPDDPLIAGSAFVAKLSNEIVDTLIAMETEQGKQDSAEKWGKWRSIDISRAEWSVAIQRAREGDTWESWSPRKKAEFARILLSPFTIDDGLLSIFIEEAENT